MLEEKKVPEFNPDDVNIEVNEETKKGIHGLRKFIEYWDNDVKVFARKCIEPTLPLYIELSQVSSDTERFVKNNKIVSIKNEETGEVKYQYENGDELNEKDAKVILSFQKHGDKIFKDSEKAGIVDFFAVHNISEMMYAVDDCINNFKNPIQFIYKVYMVFSSDDYYETVFKDNSNCEEAENYKALAKKLAHVFYLLKDVK